VTPLRAPPPRPRPPTSDAPWPPAPTSRDDLWAVLLGGRERLALAGWGRRTRAFQSATPETQDAFGFDGNWRAVFKRIGRLDSVDPRWLDELDRLGATLYQLRWLAGPGDGCLPERVARKTALAAYLRAVGAGRPPDGGWQAVAAGQPRVGAWAPTKRRARKDAAR